MSWEYRVCKTEVDCSDIDDDDRVWYSLRSVHYWNRDETKIYLTSVEPPAPHGTTLEELKSDIDMMAKAFNKPVIDLDTIEYYEPTDEEYAAEDHEIIEPSD